MDRGTVFALGVPHRCDRPGCESSVERRAVPRTQHDRCVIAPLGQFVVCNARRRPQLLDIWKESQAAHLEHAWGTGQREAKGVIDPSSERTKSDAVAPAQHYDGSTADRVALFLAPPPAAAGTGHVQNCAWKPFASSAKIALRVRSAFRTEAALSNVTSGSPSIRLSLGIAVSTSETSGQTPGASASKWCWRYSSQPGAWAAIRPCGPRQYSRPCSRVRSSA